MMWGWVLVLALTGSLATAKEIEDVHFADQIQVGTETLVLNGVGLRTKRRIFNFRVYVAALYAKKKSNDAQILLDDPSVKVIQLVFLRPLDKDTLAEALDEALTKNCPAPCGGPESHKKLHELIGDAKDGSRLEIIIRKDLVSAHFRGKTETSGEIHDAVFAGGILRAFIGAQPPSEDLKRGLLGL